MYVFFIISIYFAVNIACASDNPHKHAVKNAATISADMAQKVNIKTGLVASQILKQSISTYGQLKASPEQLSHVRARFPGLISSVNVAIGEKVKQGAELAKVESNASLRTYTIQSPIAGTVIQRHANTGEFTADQLLFSIANFNTLWAELRIYPSQRSLVKAGNNVAVKSNELIVKSKISHLIPVIDQPYQLARIQINNSYLNLSPGDFVEGSIVVSEFTATTAVVNEAIQTIQGKKGVFIKEGKDYRFAAIKIGRSDDTFTEVLSGIYIGDEYVIKNSYLIKADIEKSEAEHKH